MPALRFGRSPRGPAEVIVLYPERRIPVPAAPAAAPYLRPQWRRSIGIMAIGLAACAAFASLALADDIAATDRTSSAFASVDRNRDGRIDLTEIRLSAFQMFAALDQDRDNVLSLDELGADGRSDFRAADADRNNGLSLDEFLDAHVVGYRRAAGAQTSGFGLDGLTDW
ncbi:MAG: EF-hand domain-containing protein [Alphaproteobacteria bacterium]|nr:EF-hand domain-containing protein [Alphaproteobacteria bacterium]